MSTEQNKQQITSDVANGTLLKLIRQQNINQDMHDMFHACRETLYTKAKTAEDLQKKVDEMEGLLKAKQEETEILLKAKQEEIAALKMTLNG